MVSELGVLALSPPHVHTSFHAATRLWKSQTWYINYLEKYWLQSSCNGPWNLRDLAPSEFTSHSGKALIKAAWGWALRHTISQGWGWLRFCHLHGVAPSLLWCWRPNQQRVEPLDGGPAVAWTGRIRAMPGSGVYYVTSAIFCWQELSHMVELNLERGWGMQPSWVTGRKEKLSKSGGHGIQDLAKLDPAHFSSPLTYPKAQGSIPYCSLHTTCTFTFSPLSKNTPPISSYFLKSQSCCKPQGYATSSTEPFSELQWFLPFVICLP